jgi:hypothetical protein
VQALTDLVKARREGERKAAKLAKVEAGKVGKDHTWHELGL